MSNIVNKLNKINPFVRFSKSLDEFERDAEHLFHYFGVPTVGGLTQPNLFPPIETRETEKSYEITAELPGVQLSDVSINIGEDTLIISGEKKLQKQIEKENWSVSELSYGSFRREIRIPDCVQKENIVASLKNGVLYVCIPKIENKKPSTRKIEIKE